jgi:hypothetical protein
MEDEFEASARLLKRVAHKKDFDERFAALRERYEAAARDYKTFKSPGSNAPPPQVHCVP